MRGLLFILCIYLRWRSVRPGHIAAPILVHSFCNHMGFPDFGAVPGHPNARALAAAYLAGIVGFATLLRPLTAPSLYANALVRADC